MSFGDYALQIHLHDAVHLATTVACKNDTINSDVVDDLGHGSESELHPVRTNGEILDACEVLQGIGSRFVGIFEPALDRAYARRVRGMHDVSTRFGKTLFHGTQLVPWSDAVP